MKKEEAKKIIQQEGLKKINWFEDDKLREDEVGIKKQDGDWVVYVTDERASIVTGSISKFDNENDALENFINRARTEKDLFNS